MSLVDRIEVTIKNRGLTFNKVEHDCKIGNGTIKRWKHQSPRLDLLVKVANYLGVSLDDLVTDTPLTQAAPHLSATEAMLLDAYRTLSDRDKQMLLDMVRLMRDKSDGGKTDSD